MPHLFGILEKGPCKWLKCRCTGVVINCNGLHEGDSTLRTLHSDTKVNILNSNLNVKMFNKGVQTNIAKTFHELNLQVLIGPGSKVKH